MIRIAAYKGKSFASRLIKLVTGGEYSHVAIMLSDNEIVEAWSSSNKVRVISSLSDGHTAKTPVDIYELPMTELQETRFISGLRSYIGVKYDWMGLVAYLFGRNMQVEKKVFCSELVGIMCHKTPLKFFKDIPSYKLSPSDIVERLKPLTHVVTK